MLTNILIDHMGDTWRLLTTGTEEGGKTNCHLASTTRGHKQANGFVPNQISDWIDTATIESARAMAKAVEITAMVRGQFEAYAIDAIAKGELQGDLERLDAGYKCGPVHTAWNAWQSAWVSAWQLAPMALRPAAWVDADTLAAMGTSPKGKPTRWPVYTLSDWESKARYVPLFMMGEPPTLPVPSASN